MGNDVCWMKRCRINENYIIEGKESYPINENLGDLGHNIDEKKGKKKVSYWMKKHTMLKKLRFLKL